MTATNEQVTIIRKTYHPAIVREHRSQIEEKYFPSERHRRQTLTIIIWYLSTIISQLNRWCCSAIDAIVQVVQHFIALCQKQVDICARQSLLENQFSIYFLMTLSVWITYSRMLRHFYSRKKNSNKYTNARQKRNNLFDYSIEFVIQFDVNGRSVKMITRYQCTAEFAAHKLIIQQIDMEFFNYNWINSSCFSWQSFCPKQMQCRKSIRMAKAAPICVKVINI